MKIHKEAGAELVLGYFFPDLSQSWNVRCMGTFYRNYSGDSLFVDERSREVELARDGFLKTLPENFYSDKDEFSGKGDLKERHDALVRRENILKEMSIPFDSCSFRQRMCVEKKISALLRDKASIILSEYHGFDVEAVEDPLVRKAALMLPELNGRRGDPEMVKTLLASLLHCRVEMDLSHRYSDGESCRAWVPEVVYLLDVPGLDREGFKRFRDGIAPLEEFIRDRLMPFDLVFTLQLRDGSSVVKKDLVSGILEYNTEII